VKSVARLLLRRPPNEYFRFRLWQFIAIQGGIDEFNLLAATASHELRDTPKSSIVRAGVWTFIVAAAKQNCSGLPPFSKCKHENDIVLASAVPEIGHAILQSFEVAREVLSGKPHTALALAPHLISNKVTHRHFDLQVSDLPEMVQSAFRYLGIIKRRRLPDTEPIASVFEQVYDFKGSFNWKTLLKNDYLQAYRIAMALHASWPHSRNNWLMYQNSFNEILIRNLLRHLAKAGITGLPPSHNNGGQVLRYGQILNNSRMRRSLPVLQENLEAIHNRRNTLPQAHSINERRNTPTKILARSEVPVYRNYMIAALQNVESGIADSS
jgi:hypothetical protein